MSTPSELWALGGTPQPAAFSNWGTKISADVDATTARVATISSYELNVKDFGAAGDDATDDTVALEAAFAAGAAQGRTVVVPPGTYRVDEAYISECMVRGFGPTSILKRKEGATLSRCLRVDGDNVTIRDLTLDGNGSASGTSNDGIVHTSVGISHLTIENCWIRNTYFHGLRIINASGHIRIINNLIEYGSAAGGYGIIMNSQDVGAPTTIDDVCVMGNTLVRHPDNASGYGMMIRGSDDLVTRTMENVRIIGNRVDHMNNPVGGLAIETWSDHCVISNNVVTGGEFGISYAGSRGAIMGNVVREIEGPGIEAVAGPGGEWVTCIGNVVENCKTGIAAWGGANRVVISSNTLNFCEPGIHCSADGATVTGNIVNFGAVDGTTTTGIWFQGGKSVTCSGNLVMLDPANAGTGVSGIVFGDSDEITCVGNIVDDASTGIVIGQSVNPVNGTVVGNHLLGCTTKLTINLSGTGTVGQLQRWANAGILPTVSGSRSGNAALADLLAELGSAGLGVITDSTTA